MALGGGRCGRTGPGRDRRPLTAIERRQWLGSPARGASLHHVRAGRLVLGGDEQLAHVHRIELVERAAEVAADLDVAALGVQNGINDSINQAKDHVAGSINDLNIPGVPPVHFN